jgi:hypothetical protein
MMRTTPALLLLATGCVASAVYGTARPLAPGAFQAALLAEQGVEGDAILAPDRSSRTFVVESPGPGVELRVGLEPGVDFGLRISTASGVLTDVKIGLLNRAGLALALDPAFQLAPYTYARGEASGQGSLRMLGTWRVSDGFELTGHLSGGALLDRTGPQDEVVATWGGGVGPLFRLSPSVALQPSLTSLWRSDRASWHPELALGLGILLGRETR